MEQIKSKINNSFYQLFSMKNHPFFRDIEKVNKISDNFIEYKKGIINKTLNYKKTKLPNNENIKINYKKELTNNNLKKLNKQIDSVMSYNKILKIVASISSYLIKSNVTNYNNLYKKFKQDKNKINICIIGAGPTGLFLAIYLHKYYNEGSLNHSPKVNILIFDNRIDKSKFRKPYSRHRPFSTSSNYLSFVLPKLYCYQKNKDYLFLNIYVLEYMLFSKVKLDYNIPFIFEDYDWNEYKNIFDQANIDVVFDCTGSKLKTDIFKNINTSWLNKINKVNKKIKKQLAVNKDQNLVHLIDYPKDKKFKKNHFYGSMMVYDNKMNFINKFDIDINDSSDLKLLSKLKKKYYNYENTMNILSNFKDKTERNFLYNILLKYKEVFKNHLFIFDIWAIYIRHCIQPCEIFKVSNKKILYIGAGDTIFHSHFITGAGLNRTLTFGIKCANLLTLLKD